MRRAIFYISAFVAIFAISACEPAQTISEPSPTPQEPNNPPQEPEPEPSPTPTPTPETQELFSIEVSNITSTTACVSISPKNNELQYYFDLLRAEYYNEFAENFGFQRFIDITITSLTKTHNITKEQAIAKMLSSGVATHNFTNLDAATQYYVVAMCIDSNGQLTSEIIAKPFYTSNI